MTTQARYTKNGSVVSSGQPSTPIVWRKYLPQLSIDTCSAADRLNEFVSRSSLTSKLEKMAQTHDTTSAAAVGPTAHAPVASRRARDDVTARPDQHNDHQSRHPHDRDRRINTTTADRNEASIKKRIGSSSSVATRVIQAQIATNPAISAALGLTEAIRNKAIGVERGELQPRATSGRHERLASHIAKVSAATHKIAETRRYAGLSRFADGGDRQPNHAVVPRWIARVDRDQ